MDILLIEDEVKTAESVKAFLQEYHLKVDHTADASLGLKYAMQKSYDIIVSDVVLPGFSGIDLCKLLREKGIQTPILIISAMDQSDDKILGLNAGADDYLSKPFDMKELIARIYALKRRVNNTSKTFEKLKYNDLELNLANFEVSRNGEKILLTPREFALLEYLVKNQERVVPKLEILEKVWNLNDEINTNVVEVYVNYVRKKIDKGFATKLIHTHFGIGYILKS